MFLFYYVSLCTESNLHYINISWLLNSHSSTTQSIRLFEMALILPIFISVLFAGTLADTKILDTPDGKIGPETCVRSCSGVDKDYSRWTDSGNNPGKVYKWIDMSGCEFVSQPVITVTSGQGTENDGLCPSFTAAYVQSKKFFLYSVTNFRADTMKNNACRVFWTATGFTC